MKHPSQDRGPATLLRDIVLELGTFPDRIPRALAVMSDARSPLRANSYEAIASGGGGPDPGQTEIAAQAEQDRKRLLAAINDINRLSLTIRSTLAEWNPIPAKPGMTIWCENHLAYGHHVTRPDDGSRNCSWCSNVHRAYGVWPGRKLVELHDQGRRISEQEYRRLLGKGTAA